MADIIFRRIGTINRNGSVPGELRIGQLRWPTIERGIRYTFVRKGEYRLLMTHKIRGRHVPCLCFFDHPVIRSHLIHEALDDSHLSLTGCIAPGLAAHADGIRGSGQAMDRVFEALRGFRESRQVTISVENNIIGRGQETKEEWIRRRVVEGRHGH